MVNIKDVAKAASVSIASVSRYFNNPILLAPATRERIAAAVRELNFTPSSFGSALRTRRSGRILILLPTVANPMYQKIIQSIDKQSALRGMQSMVCITDNNDYRERELLGMLANHSADGAVLFSSVLKAEELDELGRRYPIVQCCEATCGVQSIPSVTVDNEAAARHVAEHFIRMGHRRFAMIAGMESYESTGSRVRGFVQALHKAGMEWREDDLVYGRYGYGSGERAALQLLQKEDRPTAIFAFSDAMAIGALCAARKCGIIPGKELAVCGFDDTGIARVYEPSVTSVHQPREQMGKYAFELLEKRMNRKNDVESVILEHKLELRDSSNFQYKGE